MPPLLESQSYRSPEGCQDTGRDVSDSDSHADAGDCGGACNSADDTSDEGEGSAAWLGDFNTELAAIPARGQEAHRRIENRLASGVLRVPENWQVRERLLFEDVDRAGWFSAAGISALEANTHPKPCQADPSWPQSEPWLRRFSHLLPFDAALPVSEAAGFSSRVRSPPAAAKTVGEKLQSSLVCLAAVAVAPVPGSSEMWLATTTMMWLDKDQAWQHVVYEHPRDVNTDTILDQFQCRSSKALLGWERVGLPV
ncbi:EXD3 [Symbiodinium sp. CCMP2592]|nr:EXD3 [Symbiodinium sp. CCMP2592]